MKATDALRRAADILEARAKERDLPGGERSMARTVAAFNTIYGTNLTTTMGWQFMVLLKMVRGSTGAYQPDDHADQIGYSSLAAEQAEIDNERKSP